MTDEEINRKFDVVANLLAELATAQQRTAAQVAEKLTPEQLSESGRKAVQARWAKAKALAESKSNNAA